MLPSHLQRVFYEKLTAPLVAAAKPAPGVVEELRGSKAAGLNLWADPSAEWTRRKYDILLDRPLHVHLGIIFLANMELGFLCPPVGLNLLLSSYRFNKPMAEVTRATFPMLLVLLVGVLLITYFPPLTTFLPHLFR